jgi:SAM-dependent methyltransferase
MDAIVDVIETPDVGLRTPRGVVRPAVRPSAASAPAIPDYLVNTYYWAYLNPRNVRLLDRELVVSVILWGQHLRLRREAFRELRPGQKVLQPASVYGDFSPALARHLGPGGSLDVIDVAPIQAANSRRKLWGLPQVTVRRADAAAPGGGPYDAVCCYFLLHELPDDYKRAVVDALLMSVVPGGKVVFMDYHKPHPAHPLKGMTSIVFDTLEPYAKGLWRHEISDFASAADGFVWSKETYFGGLFQKTVARRPHRPARAPDAPRHTHCARE